MKIRENVPLASLTTMRIGGDARYVIELTQKTDIPEALDFALVQSLPVWLMGGGANTLAHDEGFEGVVILNKLTGIEVLSENEERLKVRAMGGVAWDDLVDLACRKGFSGIEAMSAIPGTVGAAPVQNIGAYGQDLAQIVVSVEAYDRDKHEFVTLTNPEMNLGYRHTRFNYGEDAGRFLVVSVTLELKKQRMQPPFYNSLQRYIDEHGETDFAPQNIRRMVMAIRSGKLPDPTEVPSAGSFFKNIYVDKAGVLAAEERSIPVWRDEKDGVLRGGKINGGWLIEACGLKGQKLHGYRISEKAALVLINEDGVGYEELDLARKEIIETVRRKFGFTLEQEPVEIPVRTDFVRKAQG